MLTKLRTLPSDTAVVAASESVREVSERSQLAKHTRNARRRIPLLVHVLAAAVPSVPAVPAMATTPAPA